MEVFLLLIGFLITFLLMPINFKICHKFGLFDKPDHRKVHQSVKLRGGGISIYVTFFLMLIGIYIYTQKIEFIGIIISSLLLFVTGVLDDKYSLNAKLKLLLQISSASIIYLFGISISHITIFHTYISFSPLISFCVTIFWVILLINAMNLIDGLDGLASGVGIIILITTILFSQNDIATYMALGLIGSLLAFLRFNFFPSKIFLGDTGSMFLGYAIALISILGMGKTVVGISTILLMVSFPLLDVGLAIIRRLMNKQPIFSPDKNHIHHCLLNKGFSHRKAVLMIYGINMIFVGLAVFNFYTYSVIGISILSIIISIIFTLFLVRYLKVLPKLHKN